MARRATAGLVLGLVLASTAAGTAAERPASGELVVSRGDLRDRLVLTGELDSVSAEVLKVPRTSEWLIQLKWLEADGTPVKAGQKVADFDNSAFAADLSEKKLAAVQAADDLEKQRDQSGITTAEKAFDVEKAKSELETARIDAAIDKDSLPGRVWQENQLELERKQTAYAKAKDDLEAQEKSAALDLEVKQIALDKSLREIRTAEEAIANLELRAPRDGVVVIADNPREGRKLEVGDTIWVGLPVVRLPDLAEMQVKAALSDVDDGRVAVGMKVICTLDAYADRPIEGVVSEISPVARAPLQRSQRRSFQVIVSLPGKNPEQLLPGLSAKVEVSGREAHDVLLAPRVAIDFSANPPQVHTVDGRSVDVDVGLCVARACEVMPHGEPAKAALSPGLRLRAAGGEQ
ncbi:MAG: HlyD family secretion protein [Polyangiaceae bacterium]|jgi:HlyD family secretion protein